MLIASLALAFSLQAMQTESPRENTSSPVISETWELAYDVAITPFIEDYRRCLNYGNRIARGVPDFEDQHRTDIPRCAKVYQESIKASNRMMDRRGRTDQFTPEDVKRAFDMVGYIHVQRGRFIDDRFQQRRQVLAQYQATHQRSTAPLDDRTSLDLEEEAANNAED